MGIGGRVWIEDMEALGEDAAMELLARLGPGAFEEGGEERLYLVPEAAKLGWSNFVEAAAAAGAEVWAGDAGYACAADVYCEKGKERELARLLRFWPPEKSNPWRKDRIDWLWESCARKGLLEAQAELAKLGPPPQAAWDCAMGRSMDALSAACRGPGDLSPGCCAAAAKAWRADLVARFCAMEGFDGSRFADPWTACAGHAGMLRSLRMAGVPAGPWKRLGWFGSAWSKLASAGGARLGLMDCAAELLLAGVRAADGDLAAAMAQPGQPLADAVEQAGGEPSLRCADLSCLQGGAGDVPEPGPRLRRWLREGKMDWADPRLYFGRSRAAAGWPAGWARQAARLALEGDASAAADWLLSAQASPSLAKEGRAALERALGASPGFGQDALAAARAGAVWLGLPDPGGKDDPCSGVARALEELALAQLSAQPLAKAKRCAL